MIAQMKSRIAFKSMGGKQFLNITTQHRVSGLADGFFARIRRNRTGANAVKITHLDDGAYEVEFWRTPAAAGSCLTGSDSRLVTTWTCANAKDALETFEKLTGLHI